MRKTGFRLFIIAVVLILGYQLWSHRFGVPEEFASDESHFKYGSIGADHPLARAPLPYWIWKVLPEVFPPAQVMPKTVAPYNPVASLAAFGLVTEDKIELPLGNSADQPAFARPIGFSKRRVFGMDFAGMNCAFCHLTSVRSAPDAKPDLVLGGTGNTVDIERYFLFMFAALDPKVFKADVVMPAIDRELARQKQTLNFVERLLYRYVFIPVIPMVLGKLEVEAFDFISVHSPTRLPNFGPGRVDTWSLYKRLFVKPPQRDGIPGIVDFPAIWNQKARIGMRMHWDGNTDVLQERNIVSALALIGSRLDYLDYPSLMRVSNWSEGLLPPRYQDRYPDGALPGNKGVAVQSALVERGSVVFRNECANCHAGDGQRVGRVEPLDGVGGDAHRIKDFTHELADSLNTLGTSVWQLRNFKPQVGYVNNLLDGIWLRAPYLHNGSVPTLRDLLNGPEQRPKKFCRGSDVYDWGKVGFASALDASGGCGMNFVYDTAVPGNGNGGHFYGTSLPAADKDALLEFMKTL
jgi:hypothetical protein